MAEPASEAPLKALTCPACGAPVALHAAGYTVSVACAGCGATLDALAPDLALIAKADSVSRMLRIPLGARGEIDGVAWDVIGYMERTADGARWSEYLLFNPYYGYRFLIDDGRCWSLGRLLDAEPISSGIKERKLAETRLTRFGDPYDATVQFVLGEFYWRVTAGETVRVTDYAAPGVMLSLEEAEDELTWTRSDLVDDSTIERAFGAAKRSHLARQASPHEPSPYTALVTPIWTTTAIALCALVGLCFLGPPQMDLGRQTFSTRLDAPEQTTTIGDFDLPRPHNRVVIQALGEGLDNEWIDADLSLVDEKTQQSYDGYALTEHYSGYDSDGAWSEGSPVSSVVFSHVPRGRYRLVVDYSAHTWTNTTSWSSTQSPSWNTTTDTISLPDDRPGPQLGLIVKAGGMGGWNAILAAIAILAGPGALSAAQYVFERRRQGLV